MIEKKKAMCSKDRPDQKGEQGKGRVGKRTLYPPRITQYENGRIMVGKHDKSAYGVIIYFNRSTMNAPTASLQCSPLPTLLFLFLLSFQCNRSKSDALHLAARFNRTRPLPGPFSLSECVISLFRLFASHSKALLHQCPLTLL